MRPCPTCRQQLDHLVALDVAIADLGKKARVRRGALGVLADLADHFSAAEKATKRHRKHREKEHRDAIRVFAAHLPVHSRRRSV